MLKINTVRTDYDNIGAQSWTNVQFSDGKTISLPVDPLFNQRWELLKLQVDVLRLNPISKAYREEGPIVLWVFETPSQDVRLTIDDHSWQRNILTPDAFYDKVQNTGKGEATIAHKEAFRQFFLKF